MTSNKKTPIPVDPTVQRLLARLRELGITLAEFRKKHDIASQKFNNWKTRGIPQERFLEFARDLRMNPDYLKNGRGKIEANWVEATFSMPVSMDSANEHSPPTFAEEQTLLKIFRSLGKFDRQRLLIYAEALETSTPAGGQ